MKQKLLQGFKYSLFSPFMYSLWRGKKNDAAQSGCVKTMFTDIVS